MYIKTHDKRDSHMSGDNDKNTHSENFTFRLRNHSTCFVFPKAFK